MMFKNKEVRVKLSEEATEVYNELRASVEEERKRGIENSFHQTLLRSIERVWELLKENPFAGDQVSKRQIPSKYIKLYDVDNVWRVELSKFWRLVYTITGNQVEIITFIMDIFNHQDYDRVFGYRKK